MVMHHVLIIVTLTFIQGSTVLKHENSKCLIFFRNCLSNVIDFEILYCHALFAVSLIVKYSTVMHCLQCY